jgi:hypothetical protein
MQIFFLRKFFIAFILTACASNIFAQSTTLKKIENDLVRTYSKIFPFYYGNHDSLDFYSSLFSEKIRKYIDENPTTLNYSFQKLEDSNVCTIATSGDGLFRIYSWDTWEGGTMHDFGNIYQYNANGKIHSKYFTDDDTANLEDVPSIPFYSKIFTLKANDHTYYLGINNSIFSTRDVGQGIKIFTIEKDTLNDNVKLIKTASGLTNEIDVDFDFFTVIDRTNERPITIIKYDPATKIIYIPIVYEDGKVSHRFILYQFNGQYFERVPAKKH